MNQSETDGGKALLEHLRAYLAFPVHNPNCIMGFKTWANTPEHCDCGLFQLLKTLRAQGVEIPNHFGKTAEEIAATAKLSLG